MHVRSTEYSIINRPIFGGAAVLVHERNSRTMESVAAMWWPSRAMPSKIAFEARPDGGVLSLPADRPGLTEVLARLLSDSGLEPQVSIAAIMVTTPGIDPGKVRSAIADVLTVLSLCELHGIDDAKLLGLLDGETGGGCQGGGERGPLFPV